jgi:ELWxxDGT repeat protein
VISSAFGVAPAARLVAMHRALLAVSIALALAALSAAPVAAAGPPVLVKAIQTYTADAIYNSGFSGFARASATLTYFGADSGNTGGELWKTDGTLAGTKLIKDIRPGYLTSDPKEFTLVGSTLYFVADDGVNGPEVWMSDGSGAGTVRVTDSVADPASLAPMYLMRGGSRVYFEAGVFGARHLFSVSGSDVRDHGFARGPFGFLNGFVYYAGSSSGIYPYSLFRTDGSGPGSEYDADATFQEFSSPNAPFAAAGGELFFGAEAGVNNYVLWKTTGAASSDAAPQLDHNNAQVPQPGAMQAAGGKVYFSVFDGNEPLPAVTNGTNAGTGRLGDPTGAVVRQDYPPSTFVAMGSRVYFTAGDGTRGMTLWKTTGAVGNLTKVKSPGASNQAYMSAPVLAKGFLWFGFADGTKHSFWKSDGTTAGTTIVRNFGATGQVNEMVVRSTAGANPSLLMSARDAAHGMELWSSNGTSAGTKLLKDINAHTVGSEPVELTSFKNKLFFGATTGRNRSNIFMSNGTSAGTSLVKRFALRNAAPESLTVVGSTLFFAGFDKQGWNLWKSDGTKAGTVQVKDLQPNDREGQMPRSLTAFGGKLYFSADDGAKGTELWVSNGTAAGTKRVKDIRPGANGSFDYGSPMVVVGNYLYFSADDGTNGVEIWRTDGTAAGTTRVTNLAPGSGSAYPYGLTVMGGELYFVATPTGTSTYGVYKTAGSGQTELFAPSGFPQFLTAIDGKVYFQATDGVNGTEIWQTTGAAATAFTNSSEPDFQPRDFTKAGSSIYFVAYDSTNGTELWKTDGVSGSSPNTAIVMDINPTGDSLPVSLTEANGVLYFGADDGTHRLEPWRTTPTGAELVADINPNDNSLGYGWPFVKVGSNLYFAASNWGNGAALNLWKIAL